MPTKQPGPQAGDQLLVEVLPKMEPATWDKEDKVPCEMV